MSRLVVLFVSLVAVLGMVACGGDDVSVPSLLDDAGLEPGAGGADATVEGGSGPVADASSPLDGGSLDAALDATVDAGVLGDAGADAETDAAAPASYDLSFTVSGLAGTGLFLADNGADLYAVTGNGTFTFNAKVPSGGRYSVGVLQQPSSPAQTCAFTDPAGNPVAAPSGTIGSAADVPTILVQCTTRTFTVGGTVTGLASGATLTVQNEGGDTTTVTGTTASSIPFALNTKVAAGDAYSVGVFGQPSAQSCSVNGGSGNVVSGNVTSVSINCSTNTVTIGGTVTGSPAARWSCRTTAATTSPSRPTAASPLLAPSRRQHVPGDGAHSALDAGADLRRRARHHPDRQRRRQRRGGELHDALVHHLGDRLRHRQRRERGARQQRR